jgi:DegV family protein with EDD domain
VLFLVDTLEFLRRGGRIGGAAAFLGTAFNVKPILELRDGRIEPVEKVRTRGKALERMLDILEERIDHKPPIRLAALHANAMEDGQTLLERARARFSTSEVDEIALSDVSPAIGVHAGPGTLGICYMAGM